MQIKQSFPTIQGVFNYTFATSQSTLLFITICLATFSFVCTLFLPSIGEEGVYTNITLEMLHHKNYWTPTLFGTHYARPPLFNWLMILVTNYIGPTQVVLAARIVNAAATVSTAIILFSFIRYKFTDKQFALFTTAIFLSGDLLFKRGWLAYADSLFSFCIFAAIVCLWIALDKQQVRWICLAVFSISCAFLTKVHTAYIFYGVAGLILLLQHPNRKFLFKPMSWILHILALAFPIYWAVTLNDGYGDVDSNWKQSQSFLQWPGMQAYIIRVVVYFPFELLCRFFPASLLAIIAWRQLRNKHVAIKFNHAITIVFWIGLLNILLYWAAPNSNIRYILPMYPFLAACLGYIIWYANDQLHRAAVMCLLAGVIFKYIYAIAWLPYEHITLRGDAVAVATAINHQCSNTNLYINDSTSAGLRVSVALNKLRYPQEPLHLAPNNYTGYLISDNYNVAMGELLHTYNLRNNKVYLSFKAGAS